MCTVTAALMSAQAGASLYSGIAAGKTAKAQADAQATAMEQNATTSRILGHDAIERGGLEELRLRRELAQYRGSQRVQAASSGVDIDTGSALDARNATISEGEHDAAAIRFNAARQRWGYEQNAANLEAQAANTRAAGKYAKQNALIGSVLNFGLDIAQTANEYSKQQESSPLTEKYDDDRSKYWGPVYNPIQRKKRGYA